MVCGGFLLLVGDRFSLGRSQADIVVQADWPRRVGAIQRQSGDYFWCPDLGAAEQIDGTSQASPRPGTPTLVRFGRPLEIAGSASVMLDQPSRLSTTAVLRVAAPHRFDRHVDAVVLVDQAVLIGPGKECHLRHRESTAVTVLVYRQGVWSAKLGIEGTFSELVVGRAMTLGSVAMTLELV